MCRIQTIRYRHSRSPSGTRLCVRSGAKPQRKSGRCCEPAAAHPRARNLSVSGGDGERFASQALQRELELSLLTADGAPLATYLANRYGSARRAVSLGLTYKLRIGGTL